jgi:hypothetical protein
MPPPPPEFPALRFPVRFTAAEKELLQRVADLVYESKQQVARRAVREYCLRMLQEAER